MLRFGVPERPSGGDFGDGLAGPQAGGVDVRDGVQSDALLLVTGVENRRPVAQARSLP